jgi:hypothetical protein
MDKRVLADIGFPELVGGCQRQLLVTNSHPAASSLSELLVSTAWHSLTRPCGEIVNSTSVVPCSFSRLAIGG